MGSELVDFSGRSIAAHHGLCDSQPFNHAYIWDNTTANEIIADPSISELNTFKGSITQQATSVVTATDPLCYEYDAGCFSIYGFEYKPGFEDGVCVSLDAWSLRAITDCSIFSAVYHLGVE